MKDNIRLLMKKPRRSILLKITLLAILSFTAITTAQAAQKLKTFTFIDPVGDNKGTIDVTEMVMTFNKNGNYQIVLTATADKPFFGQFRVSINLFNADVTPNNSLFQDVCKKCGVFSTNSNKGNDFNLLVPSTSLTLNGHSKILKFWNAGNRVATATWAGLGNPPGSSLFRSSIDNFPQTFLTKEDVIGCNDNTWNGTTMVCEMATILVAP